MSERIRRRDAIGLIGLGAFSKRLNAQEPYPGVRYRDYSRCLPDYLTSLVKESYERRNRELAALATPDKVQQRQKWARDTFWRLMNGQLERTPLNLKTLGTFERPGYRVEKLVYESQPGLHVTANLYIPANAKGPLPGVLFQMGHAVNGKAGATYQRCCQGLVKLGYLVLGFDPMGQGERIYYPGPSGTRSVFDSADDEHTYPGQQFLLTGNNVTRLQTWDAVRSLDVLSAHPLVDPKRIASTGQSGGGTLTMMLAAGDDRISAAVVCSGNTENFACGSFNPPGSTDDAEQNLLGSVPLGFDRWDMLYPLAPKPLLVSVSDKDFFGTYSPRYISNGWEEFQKLKRVYEVFGAGDRLQWGGTALPHGLSYDTRLLIYNWFAKYLQGSNEPVREEPSVTLEKDEELWAAPTGNVLSSFRGVTPFTLNRDQKVAPDKRDLHEFLGVQLPAKDLRPAIVKRMPYRDVDVEAVEIQVDGPIWSPAWIYIPRRAKARTCTIALAGSRLANWHEDEMYADLAGMGHVVVVPDLRGVGDLTPEYGSGAARHARSHNDEDSWAWAFLMAGKPLLSQRVTDVLAWCAAVRNHSDAAGLPVCVAATGKMTVPAQIAAALDKTIKAIYLHGGLVSFRHIVESERYEAAFANFVPGFLRVTDLPEIVASIAPRRVQMARMVDGSGRATTPQETGTHVAVKESAWNAASVADFLQNFA